MTLLHRSVTAFTPPDSATFASRGLGGGWARPLLLGAGAAGLSLVLIVAPALAVWLTTSESSASFVEPVRLAAAIWLLGHAVPLDVVTAQGLVPVSFVPLTLFVANIAIAQALARYAVRHWRPGSTQVLGVASDLLEGAGLYLAGYAGVGLLATLATLGTAVYPHPVVAVVTTAAMALLGIVIAMWREHPQRLERFVPTLARVTASERWSLLRPVWRPAREVLVVLSVVATLVVAVVVAVGWDRIGVVSSLLEPGLVGAAVLVLLQLALAANLATWAIAFVAGPGFTLGVGSAITSSTSSPGLMPMIPVLGALPAEGSYPAWLRALALVPVLVGAVAGWRVDRSAMAEKDSGRPVVEAVARCLLLGSLVGLVVGALAAVGSGSVGVDRLAVIGPEGLVLGAVLAGQTCLGALVGTVVSRRWRAPSQPDALG